MWSSKSNRFITFLLVLCLLFWQTCSESPLFHSCFGQQKYSTNSTFAANLNETLNLLTSSVAPNGFVFGSTGHGQNEVNALVLCRGDTSMTNCKACVVDAIKLIRDLCPNKKGAIIWYDYCLLKYSNVGFFGKIDTINKFYMVNIQKTDSSPVFHQSVKELLSNLSEIASVSPKLYATGEVELGESENLYGLVQCTGDLSSLDCKSCIDGAISELQICCHGKPGGRVIGGSCNIRYALYPFVDS